MRVGVDADELAAVRLEHEQCRDLLAKRVDATSPSATEHAAHLHMQEARLVRGIEVRVPALLVGEQLIDDHMPVGCESREVAADDVRVVPAVAGMSMTSCTSAGVIRT
jgi:hypothetical protein